MSFKNLKNQAKNNIEVMSKKVLEASGGGGAASFKDERFWNVTKGKDGNGSALVRFLPAPDGEDLCWAKYYTNRFDNKQTGKFYNTVSPTTFGKPCPVSELNKKMWSSGEKAKQEFVSRFTKRNETYVLNIYVIKDPGNPENEGRTFLFRCGKKIFEKVAEAFKKDELTEREPFDPFDMWNGRNFLINLKQVGGYNNYDDSKFVESSSPLLKGDDALLEKVWKSEYPLAEFTDESKVLRPYDELKARLQEVLEGMQEYEKVMGISSNSGSHLSTQKPKVTSNRPQPKAEQEDSPFEADGGDSDNVIDFYKKLSQE